MKLTTSTLLNVVGLGWTAITMAQSPSDDCYTIYHDSTEMICSASTCVFPKSSGWSTSWSEVTTTLVETVTAVAPSTIYPPTSTEIISVTEVLRTTDTITIATTAPIILTVTTTSTLRVTLCETRDVNPTYTASLPIPTEHTWGCPPGTICKPPQVNCNFERGLPSPDYHCSPDQCVPVPALLPISFWGEPVFGDESPLTNNTLFFDISSGYFNMNPLDYDLSYDIFYQTAVYAYTTTVYPPTATGVQGSRRQKQLFVPAVCYDECNDAMLEAQAMGKTSALCLSGSAFEVTTSMCELCIQAHKTDSTADFVQIQPQFQQFLDYCSKLATHTSTVTPVATVTVVPFVSTLAVSETVTWSSSTYTFIIPTSTMTSGLETIYPSTKSTVGTTGVPEPTISSSDVTVLSSTVTTFTTKTPATSTTSKEVNTGPGQVSSSHPSSGLSTVPKLTSAVVSTVTTLSGSGASTQGSTSTTAPSSTTTTPAASQFTNTASKLRLPLTTSFVPWTFPWWTGIAVLMFGNL